MIIFIVYGLLNPRLGLLNLHLIFRKVHVGRKAIALPHRHLSSDRSFRGHHWILVSAVGKAVVGFDFVEKQAGQEV